MGFDSDEGAGWRAEEIGRETGTWVAGCVPARLFYRHILWYSYVGLYVSVSLSLCPLLALFACCE